MTRESEKTSRLWSAPFLICVIVLGIGAAGFPVMARMMKVVLAKDPVPLRAPLSRLDKNRLGPYRFVSANTIDPAVVDTLGTTHYIDWFLEDTTYSQNALAKEQASPLRYVQLFITYYTGKADAVPHTPDVCYKGNGYQIVDANNETVTVRFHSDTLEVPVRRVGFIKSSIFAGNELPVIYTFHCNGQFAATREHVRNLLANPLDKHAYYSKVEVTFGWDGARPRFPTPQEARAATEKLFGFLLPQLLDHHWPDWSSVEASDHSESS